MACPFTRHSESFTRQPSVVVVEQTTNWGIEDDFAEIPDALTLTHLQAAIQFAYITFGTYHFCFSLTAFKLF